jgi:hypothetical protein
MLLRKLSRLALISAVFLFCWVVIGLLWDNIWLPYDHSTGIIGTPFGHNFNPKTSLVRYLLFTLLPASIFLILFIIPKTRQILILKPESEETNLTKAANLNADDRLSRGLRIFSVFIVVTWGSAFALYFFMERFYPIREVLNIFHEGEFLTPAYNYLKSGGLWTSSVFPHGVFYDPLATVLGWKLFGTVSVGASRVVNVGLLYLIPLALIFYFIVVSDVCTEKGEWVDRIILLQLLLFTYTVAFKYQAAFLPMERFAEHPKIWGLLEIFSRRDVPVLLGVSFLLIAIRKRSIAYGFIAGLFSAISYFYTIDRGAYFTATLLIVLALSSIFTSDRRSILKVILGSVFGILSGWAVFWIYVGHTEFKAFIAQTSSLYSTISYLTDYPIAKPGIDRAETIIMALIAIQLFGALYFLIKDYMKKRELHLLAAHSSLVMLAFFYFRSALGRPDTYHMRYASSFSFLGFAFLVWLAIRKVKKRAAVILIMTLLLAFNSYSAIHRVSKLSVSRMLDSKKRIRKFVAAPDYEYLEENDGIALRQIKEIFKDEPCFFTITGDAAYSYLLKKPSCGKYFSPVFASLPSHQKDLIDDLKEASPRYILFDSPSVYNDIDGVPRRVRLSIVYEYLEANYDLFKEFYGYKVYKKKTF